MGLFRRARGTCPKCGRKKQADIGENRPKVKKWSLTCSSCGTKFTVEVDPAWWICFRDDNGRLRRRKIGQGKRAAGRVLSKVKVEIAEGRYIDRKARCKVTLGELKDSFTDHTRSIRRRRSRNAEASTWRRLLEFFGHGVLIDKIGERDIEAYRRKREGDGKAVASINRELSNLSGALSWAVRNGIIDKKPHVKMPNPHNERERFLTKEEAKRLISYCPADIRPIIQAALFTGMRRGELLEMKWSWVDLQNLMIMIPPSATKNGQRRHVPISDNMYRVLMDLRRRSIDGCELVFHIDGKPIPESRLAKTWRKARDKAGLKELRLHDARHSLASWLVMGGESLYTVATILGHRSLDMTQRYSHLAPGHLRAAMRHADLDPPEDGKKLHLVPYKPTGVSISKVMAENQAEEIPDGPSTGADVCTLLRDGVGLRGILIEIVKQVLESNWFNVSLTAKELGVARTTLLARMRKYGIPKHWPVTTSRTERTYPRGMTLRRAEEAIIRQALELNGFNKTETARALGIARCTLTAKVRMYKIAPAQVGKITEKTPKNVHLLFTQRNPSRGSVSEYARKPPSSKEKTILGVPPHAPLEVSHITQSCLHCGSLHLH